VLAGGGDCFGGLGGERGGGVVFAGDVVPADVKHLKEHAGAVEQWVDAGSVAMGPGYGDFLYFEAEFAGEEKNFGVESPALDFLAREDGVDGRTIEGFESALRVSELKAEGEAEQQVEDAAEELAMQRLALGLGFGAQPAGADGDVGSGFEGGEKFGSFFDGRREVGVGEEDELSARVEHAVAYAVAFAAIAGIFYQAQSRLVCGEASNNMGRVIARSVVHDDDFCIPALGMYVRQHFFEGRAETSAFVIGGNHDAVGGRQGWFSGVVSDNLGK